jgi:hypothetical protein
MRVGSKESDLFNGPHLGRERDCSPQCSILGVSGVKKAFVRRERRSRAERLH